MMTKKHFEALAYAIRLECNDDDERERMAHIIGDVCAQFNDNFKQSQFFEACLHGIGEA